MSQKFDDDELQLLKLRTRKKMIFAKESSFLKKVDVIIKLDEKLFEMEKHEN